MHKYPQVYTPFEYHNNTLVQIIGNNQANSEFDKELRFNADIVETGYFYVEPEFWRQGDAPQLSGDDLPDSIFDDVYMWQLFLTHYSEAHSEGYYTHPTFADIFVGFAMGSNPIQVAMTGFVACNPVYNTKLDFLAFYNLVLRGSRQNLRNLPMGFSLYNTYMRLRLQSIEVVTDAQMPDFCYVTLTGVGYKYVSIPIY